MPSTASFTTPSFGCHIGHSYTAEIMATAQFEEMEKVMRAAVRVLTSGLNSASRWPEHGGDAETEASKDRHAASKQALDRAYKLRDLVEQDWLTPETSRRFAVTHNGRDQSLVSDRSRYL